jgi:hypothetical protein
MVEPEERLVEDPLFLACTRPAMVAGVPMEAMGLNLMVSATVFLAAHSPAWLLIAAALHPERGYRRMYWAASRKDVVAPANVSALASLRDLLRGDADEQVRKVAQLSDLRLLDILTWQP